MRLRDSARTVLRELEYDVQVIAALIADCVLRERSKVVHTEPLDADVLAASGVPLLEAGIPVLLRREPEHFAVNDLYRHRFDQLEGVPKTSLCLEVNTYGGRELREVDRLHADRERRARVFPIVENLD